MVPILNNRSGICPKRPWRMSCTVIRGNFVWRARRSGGHPTFSRRTRGYWSMSPCRRKIRLPRKRINGRNNLFPCQLATRVTVNAWIKRLYISILTGRIFPSWLIWNCLICTSGSVTWRSIWRISRNRLPGRFWRRSGRVWSLCWMWVWSIYPWIDSPWRYRAGNPSVFAWRHRSGRSWLTCFIYWMNRVSGCTRRITGSWFILYRNYGITVIRWSWWSMIRRWWRMPITSWIWGPRREGKAGRSWLSGNIPIFWKVIVWRHNTWQGRRWSLFRQNVVWGTERRFLWKDVRGIILKMWMSIFLWENWSAWQEWVGVENLLWSTVLYIRYWVLILIMLWPYRYLINRLKG